MKKPHPILLLLAFLLTLVEVAAAQGSRQSYRKGERASRAGEFAQAEAAYRRSLEQDSTSLYARFALGNALYEQGKIDEAAQAYQQIGSAASELTPAQISDLWHNLGNTHMQRKDYAQAAECFKQSLIAQPSEDARYNYTLAKKLQEQQDQQSQQEQQEQQSPHQDKQPQQKTQNNPQDNNNETPPMDKKTSEQILNSYKQDDDETRRKFDQKKKRQEAQAETPNKKRW